MKPTEKVEGKLAGLKRVQSSTWMAAVAEQAGKSGSDLEIWLGLQGLGYAEMWKKYRLYLRSPSRQFVQDLDKVLPGTARIYLGGPGGLPLWDLIDVDYTPAGLGKAGEPVQAKLVVNEMLCKRIFSGAPAYRSGLTLEEKWHNLFDWLVKHHYKQSWTGTHSDLEKLVQDPTCNDIALSNQRNNMNAKVMVIVIALALLSLVNEEPKVWDYASYFMEGILGQPMETRFGLEVSKHLTKLFREIM